MSDASQVIVYGASGYTGKLIAESLHNRGIPFTAAGRNEERLQGAMQIVAERAGVDAIDCEYATAEHTRESLVELFTGASVVVNVTGPFIHLGETVVEAALEAGCHYVDTTGEQNFMILVKDKWGPKFAEAGLLLAPALAYMWTIGALAAEVALEDDSVDSLNLVYYSENGVPSVASAESFMRMLAGDSYFLQQGTLQNWEPGKDHFGTIPGVSLELLLSSWGGAAEPTWYHGDQRVRNCRVYIGGDNNEQIAGLHGGIRQILEATGGEPAALDAACAQAAGSLFTEEPPKEDPSLQRGIINVEAWGTLTRRNVQLHFHSPYVMTGELIAEGCRHLLEGADTGAGFRNPAVAFDHRKLLANLEENGFLVVKE